MANISLNVGATSVNASLMTPTNIKDGSVTTDKLADGAVTTEKLNEDVRGQISDLKSALNGNIEQKNLKFSNLVLPENLFNYADAEMCKTGYWYYSTTVGSTVEATSSSSTKHYCAIKIPADYLSGKLTIGSTTETHKYVFWVGGVDADMKLLAYTTVGANDPATFDIPVGSAYILISYNVGSANFASFLPTVMVVRGETIPSVYKGYFTPYYELTDCETDISGAKFDSITEKGKMDVTSDATKVAGKFYNSNNVIYNSADWDYYTMSVTPGEVYTIDTVAGGTVRGWAFRDSSENQISIASYNGDVIQKVYEVVSVPVNATEMIVNFKHREGHLRIFKNDCTIIDNKTIVYSDNALDYYLDSVTKSNILFGKTLCCCGDSITYGADMPQEGIVTPTIESYQYSASNAKWTRWESDEPAAYGYQIAARNNMVFYNGGVSGATVQGSGGTLRVPGFSQENGEYTKLPDNIDYLTLFYGWNDAAAGSLGTIDDTTNDSYYGAYNVVLPYLIDKYPYTKIALIVPFGTDVGHRQAIRDLADKWGLACFDMMQGGTPLYYNKEPDVDVDADIVTANRTKFQANGAHPNYHGHYQIGTMLEAFLRGI